MLSNVVKCMQSQGFRVKLVMTIYSTSALAHTPPLISKKDTFNSMAVFV